MDKLLQKSGLESYLKQDGPVMLDWAGDIPTGKERGEKITSIVVPVGYTHEEINAPGFLAEYQKMIGNTYRTFPQEKFDFALLKSTAPEFQILGIGRTLDFDSDEIYDFKKHICHKTGLKADLINFVVNPTAFDRFHDEHWQSENNFGYVDNDRSVFCGPYTISKVNPPVNSPGEEEWLKPVTTTTLKTSWESNNIRTHSHEMAHLLTMGLTMQHDPCFITDYYTHRLYTDLGPEGMEEVELLKQNCVSEYFLEDHNNPGHPMPSKSFAIAKTIAGYKEAFGKEIAWHDSGLLFTNEGTGRTHRILCPGDGLNLMTNYNGLFRHGMSDKGTFEGSHFQKLLIGNLTEIYLVMENRISNPKLKEEIQSFNKDIGNYTFGSVSEIRTLELKARSSNLPKAYNYEQNIEHTMEKGAYKG